MTRKSSSIEKIAQIEKLGKLALENDDFKGALDCFLESSQKRSRLALADRSLEGARPDSFLCSRFKVQHDLEQCAYLMRKRLLGPSYRSNLRGYAELSEICDKSGAEYFELSSEQSEHLSPHFGSLAHLYQPQRLAGSALNPKLDFELLQNDFLKVRPNQIVIDQLLSEDALTELRRMALESTIWHGVKLRPHLAARLNYGLACGLVFQIAEELKERLPLILRHGDGSHPLQTVWAFKYGPRNAGIDTHADGGSVNVNLWLTPDDANLDSSSGGMVVHQLVPPKEWKLSDYTTYGSHQRIQDLMSSSNAGSIKTPYRSNRAVIFDSRLFHNTDQFSFADRYESRRVSLTFLFGKASSE